MPAAPPPDDRSPADPPQLPPWAAQLVARLAAPSVRDAVVGDFAEVYAYVAARAGRGAALRWYAGQVLRSLPAFLTHGLLGSSIMLRSYLVTALRSLRTRAFFSAINIGGLALGMAACLLLFQYVAFEFSYDRFHAGADRLYRVVTGERQPSGEVERMPHTTHALAAALAERVPGIEVAARYHPNYGTAYVAPLEAGRRTDAYREERLAYADPAFPAVFSLEMIRGDAAAALAEPGQVLLSASTARTYFGDADPIGQTLDVRGWTGGVYTVAGLFEDVPTNTHLQFDLLLPLRDLLEDDHGQYAGTDGWGWTNFVTYLKLRPDQDPTHVTAQIDEVMATFQADLYTTRGLQPAMELQPIEDIHLYTTFADTGAGYRTVYFFTLVALFILGIAWVNYVNLATARAAERAREIGVRKASGAHRRQVVAQFLMEAAVLNGLALLLALGLARLALPWLNDLAGVQIGDGVWREPRLWLGVAGVFGVGTLLVSLYPAFVLSAFKPAVVLKGGRSAGRGRDWLRRGLVVVQFAASLTLLAGTYVVYRQVDFMRAQDVGVDVDQVLVVRRPGFIDDDAAYEAAQETFKAELARYPDIAAVAASTTVPGGGFSLHTSGRRLGADTDAAEAIRMSWVSPGFADTYGLRFVAGRDLSADRSADVQRAVLLNETAARAFGFDDPAAAVGETILIGGGDSEREVVGVFEDVHWSSVKQALEPAVLGLTTGGAYFSVRMQTRDVAATLATVQATYERLFPGNTIETFFADRHFDEQYAADRRFGTLFGLFAGLALVIACLGLVGLAAYTVAGRTKEIGIRKALGASAFGVARLLLTDVVKLVALALVLTAPLLYIAANRWLETFATRIEVGPTLVVVPALAVLSIALATVAYHTLRIARLDPVKALRYE